MANRYWVGGGSSANWNATGNTNWGTASGVRDNASVPGFSDNVIFDNSANGNSPCTFNVSTEVASFDSSAYTNTFTHNGFQLTVHGNVTLGAGMTYTPATSAVIAMNVNNGILTTNGKLLVKVINNTGVTKLGDDWNFANTNTVANVTISASGIDLNGHSIKGYSATARVLIVGSASTRQIIVGSGSFANANFQNVVFSSATDVDISAITGGSGDCLGNTITGGGTTLTFTAPTTQVWNGSSGGAWSANSWTSRVPLPQDTASFNGVTFTAGQTITLDMPRPCKDLLFTGVGGSPTFNQNLNYEIYGSLAFVAAMSLSGSNTCTLRGIGTHTITTAGKDNTCALVFAGSGTYTLQDNYSSSRNVAGVLTLSGSTLNDNGKTISLTGASATFAMTGGTLNKTGNWNFGTTGAVNFWNCSGGTVNDTAGAITLTTASSSDRTFAGGGKTYKRLTYTITASSGGLIITGSNTFESIDFYDNG